MKINLLDIFIAHFYTVTFIMKSRKLRNNIIKYIKVYIVL